MRSRGVYRRRAALVEAEIGADWRTVAGVPSFVSPTLRPSLEEFVAELRSTFRDDPGLEPIRTLSSKPVDNLMSLAASLPGSQLRLNELRRPSRSRPLPFSCISGVILRVTSSSRLIVRRCCVPDVASRRILPTPSIKPVMFRTTSSLTRRFSRWFEPTSRQSSGRSTPSL